MDIVKTVENQREYFLSGKTLPVGDRIKALKLLRKSIIYRLDDLTDAFKKDFNKCEFDVISTEVAMVLEEIDYMINNVRRLSKSKRVKTSIANFPSHGKIVKEPYGVCLVVSPWNYPFQLTMTPVVDAIATGNTVIVKPSKYSPCVADVIVKILSVFDDNYVAVVLGGREENAILFEQRYDFVFFTGGTTVARVLTEKLSKYLTPCVLELGGKSPCIISDTADIKTAAKRVVWGKYLNAGQTCVAPDYILCHKKVKNEFIKECKNYINEMYYTNGKLNDDFPFVINDKHVERLSGLIDKDKLIVGGEFTGRLLAPTIMDNVSFDDKVMQEEIFGPIMPIIEYTNINETVETLKRKEKSLALYYFGNNKREFDYINTNLSYGGGCYNDVIMHLTNLNLPFGGVGYSGMGSYHGKKSFETFTHSKSVLYKSRFIELNTKYPPHTKSAEKLLKSIYKIK